MFCLRHSTNAPDRLNFKRFAHVIAKLDQNVGARAVPACRNGLFDDNGNGGCVRLNNVFQILLFIGKPDRYLIVFVRNAFADEVFFNAFQQSIRFVR